MQKETELVIALSRTPLRAGAHDRVARLLTEPVDWDAIRNLAVQWQVEPTVCGNLRTEFAAAMPRPVLDDFTALERNARTYAVTRTLLLVNLVRDFDRAGISVIVLKGPAVAIAAYGDYSRRTFGDVDLLVRRNDLPAARDFLLARGFVRDYADGMEPALISDQHALEFSDQRTKVELHWSLLSRHLRFDLGPDQLWDRAETVACMDVDIRVLAPEHLFLYLCAHGAKHEWMLFRWILDVVQLAQRMTPAEAERVMTLAERSNTKRILALALRIAGETFGEKEFPFPPRAMLPERDTRALATLVKARLDPGATGGTELLPPRLARIHPYIGTLAFWIRARERTRDQVACAARFLFVPAASDTESGVLYGLLRPARLVVTALKRIVHAS